jgi:hypothetical protein
MPLCYFRKIVLSSAFPSDRSTPSTYKYLLRSRCPGSSRRTSLWLQDSDVHIWPPTTYVYLWSKPDDRSSGNCAIRHIDSASLDLPSSRHSCPPSFVYWHDLKYRDIAMSPCWISRRSCSSGCRLRSRDRICEGS